MDGVRRTIVEGNDYSVLPAPVVWAIRRLRTLLSARRKRRGDNGSDRGN